MISWLYDCLSLIWQMDSLKYPIPSNLRVVIVTPSWRRTSDPWDRDSQEASIRGIRLSFLPITVNSSTTDQTCHHPWQPLCCLSIIITTTILSLESRGASWFLSNTFGNSSPIRLSSCIELLFISIINIMQHPLPLIILLISFALIQLLIITSLIPCLSLGIPLHTWTTCIIGRKSLERSLQHLQACFPTVGSFDHGIVNQFSG